MTQTLLLIDASPFIYAGFYGGGDDPGLRRDGLPTGAVSGFLDRILDMTRRGELKHQRFTHSVAAFDAPGKNWRHDLSDTYKANREEKPKDLVLQLQLAKHVLPMMGIHAVHQRGYEADDLIATYVRINDEDGGETVIVSSDKDLCALIRPGVVIFDPRGKKWVTEAEVRKKFGVAPSQVPDVQGLSGDTVDNIPGVPGIGGKTAAALINQFGSLETAIKNADIADIRPGLRQALVEFAEQARVSRQLVALDERVPIRRPLAELGAYPIKGRELLAALNALECGSLAKWVGWITSINPDDVGPCRVTLEMAEELAEWRTL